MGEKACIHVQDLFERMHSLNLTPSTVTFTAILYCLARNDNNCSVAKASCILSKMKNDYGLKVNTQVMNAYINALANCNDGDAAELAENALREMEEKFEAGEEDIAPGVITVSFYFSLERALAHELRHNFLYLFTSSTHASSQHSPGVH